MSLFGFSFTMSIHTGPRNPRGNLYLGSVPIHVLPRRRVDRVCGRNSDPHCNLPLSCSPVKLLSQAARALEYDREYRSIDTQVIQSFCFQEYYCIVPELHL